MLEFWLYIKQNVINAAGESFGRSEEAKLDVKNCLYEFKSRLGGISLRTCQWKALLKWFLRCQSINIIVEETKIKYKVLKALNLIRQIMARDIPKVFEGIVEVDETYLGGQKKVTAKKR